MQHVKKNNTCLSLHIPVLSLNFQCHYCHFKIQNQFNHKSVYSPKLEKYHDYLSEGIAKIGPSVR
jgi:molybdenum cofactor biosynthesis enzyme MoaA